MKSENSRKTKKLSMNPYIATTIVVIIMFIVYLFIMKIEPFGNNSILKSDEFQQHVNFLAYFREVILQGKSLFMSWNLGLGNNFFTTFAYYCASPLNLILIFFSVSNLPIGIQIITCLKMILIANSMVFFIRSIFKDHKTNCIVFAIAYAFCGFVTCFNFHIMWLDAIYILPVALVFTYKYIKHNKIYPVIISLAYAILTNYYMGFIVAFFTGIFFLVYYIITIPTEQKYCNYFINFGKKLIKFLLGIIVAFGIGMIVFIPSILQQKSGIGSTAQLFNFDATKLPLFTNIFLNNYNYFINEKIGAMFCGSLVALLLPCYYLNGNIPRKEKVAHSIFLTFMLMPIVSPFLYQLWHGFTIPNFFNYRYAFAICFLMIIMAFRTYQNRNSMKVSHILGSFLVWLIVTMMELFFLYKGYLLVDNHSTSVEEIIIATVTFALIGLLLLLMKLIDKRELVLKKETFFKVLECILLFFVVADLMIGARSGQVNNDKYFTSQAYHQHDSVMEYIGDNYLTSPETQRIVFIPDGYGSNMALRYGYSNIGYFTSARNRVIIKNMYLLGYNIQRADGLWMTSFSGTLVNYSIAGVKYYISEEKLEDNFIYGFELKECYDQKYYIYENQNELPIAYLVYGKVESKEKNPFAIQNQILASLSETQEEQNYFTPIEKSDVLILEECKTWKDEKEEKTEYTVRAVKDTNISIQSDSNLQLYLDNEPQFEDYANLWSTEAGIKPVMHLKEGEIGKFVVGIPQAQITENKEEHPVYIESSNNKKIEEVVQYAKNNSNEKLKTMLHKNGLTINTNTDEKATICLGIQFDGGWRITIDGKPTNNKQVYGAFLGVDIEPGQHTVQIQYIPIGLKKGAVLSAIFLLIFLGIVIKERKQKG